MIEKNQNCYYCEHLTTISWHGERYFFCYQHEIVYRFNKEEAKANYCDSFDLDKKFIQTPLKILVARLRKLYGKEKSEGM